MHYDDPDAADEPLFTRLTPLQALLLCVFLGACLGALVIITSH